MVTFFPQNSKILSKFEVYLSKWSIYLYICIQEICQFFLIMIKYLLFFTTPFSPVADGGATTSWFANPD